MTPIPTSSRKPKAERQKKVKSTRRKRIVRTLVFGLLIIAVVVAWQVLSAYNNSTSPTVAGRPLSNPHTHLHTVAPGERPGVLYLGTHYGLFTSTDGRDNGTSWQISTPSGLSSSAYPYSVKAGTGSAGQFYAYYFDAGWLETRDLGKHWYPITRGTLSGMQASSLLTDSYNPNHLFLGGDQGLFESHDDGGHWLHISAIQGNVQSIIATNSTPPTRLVVDETGKTLYVLSFRARSVVLI